MMTYGLVCGFLWEKSLTNMNRHVNRPGSGNKTWNDTSSTSHNADNSACQPVQFGVNPLTLPQTTGSRSSQTRRSTDSLPKKTPWNVRIFTFPQDLQEKPPAPTNGSPRYGCVSKNKETPWVLVDFPSSRKSLPGRSPNFYAHP